MTNAAVGAVESALRLMRAESTGSGMSQRSVISPFSIGPFSIHLFSTHPFSMRKLAIHLFTAALLTSVGFGALGLSGCATTQPWERETLSRDIMSVDGDEDSEALRHHVLSVREGTSGGLGGGGGGCGCN